MKNVIITILAMLVLVLGGYLIYDKVVAEDKAITSGIENTNEKKNENNTIDKEANDNDFISKYVGTYIGEKGKDSISIKEDSSYEFVRTISDLNGYTESIVSKGLVISNGVYIALVEFYDTYPTEIAPLLRSYHFYISDSKLELFGENGITDSIYFVKK